jgi:hypothetical protein
MAAWDSKQDDSSTLFEDVGPVGDEASPGPREPRAQVAIEVSFQTAADAVRGYSENVGVGQIAVLTNSPLRKGSEVTVRLRVPGWLPLLTVGKVTWSRADAMGLALTGLTPADHERLRKLVLDNTTMVERMRRQFSRQLEQPVPATVTSRVTVLVLLEDALLADAALEALNASGYVAVSEAGAGSRPNVLVAELATLGSAGGLLKSAPLVLANANGPNDLAYARMPHLRVKVFAGRPTSAMKVVQAINQIFSRR